MFFGCSHKFGKIEDGYQYCSKCGIAQVVPCNHKWVTTKEIRVLDYYMADNVRNIKFIQECSKCGEIQETMI